MKPLSIAVLRVLMKRPDPYTCLPGPLFVKCAGLVWPALRKEAEVFLSGHPRKADMLTAVAASHFAQDRLQMYMDVYLHCQGAGNTDIQGFLAVGLRSVARDAWQTDMTTGGLRVKTALALLEDGVVLDLGEDFHDALLTHARDQREKKTIPADLEAAWPKLTDAMNKHWRQTFLNNVWDLVVGEEKKAVDVFARIYGSALAAHLGSSADASEQAVRSVFPRVLERKNADEIRWMASLMQEAPEIQTRCNAASLDALRDRIARALRDTKDTSLLNDALTEAAATTGMKDGEKPGADASRA